MQFFCRNKKKKRGKLSPPSDMPRSEAVHIFVPVRVELPIVRVNLFPTLALDMLCIECIEFLLILLTISLIQNRGQLGVLGVGLAPVVIDRAVQDVGQLTDTVADGFGGHGSHNKFLRCSCVSWLCYLYLYIMITYK